MTGFFLNDDYWQVKLVPANSPVLVDEYGVLTLGVTDAAERCVYLSSSLGRDARIKVLLHEIGHCVIFSYGLRDEIQRLVKKRYWKEAEERICNFVADYGMVIFRSAYQALGKEVWTYIAQKLEVMF